MDISPKIEALIAKLTTSTSMGSIVWAKTAVNDKFQAAFKNYGVVVGPNITDASTSREPASTARDKLIEALASINKSLKLDVVNGEGKIIDSYIEISSQAVTNNVSLIKLYEAIKKNLSGIDKALDSILKELGS